ncbi:MAG TPA: Gfo/Idh/MocA family oxidoreductase [Candidatus Sulfotelmatobacter sp.]|nr:Gfo/Idh/MocA family oxidoreductase [Candidatus Sulfotelmatobacter sp.]
MIRLGLIGCGAHSETGHAIPLARYKAAHPDEILLAAVCDLQVDRALEFVRKYGFLMAYRDVDDMLTQEKLDGCIAVVPPEGISNLGIKLLNLGIPCVVEKPLGASLAEAQALRDSAAATKTPNMVSVNRRFMPLLKRAIEWTSNAGRLRYVHCTLTRHSRKEPEFLWATAVHAVDTLRHIAGQVVAFDLRTLTAPSATAWYALELQFENGISGRVDVLPTAGMVEETYDLFGEGFRASVTCPFGRQLGWRCFRDGRLVEAENVPAETPEDIVNGCYDEAATFLEALGGGIPKPSIAEVFPSVELCFAIARMANEAAAC